MDRASMEHHHNENDGTHLSPSSDDGSSGCNDPGYGYSLFSF